MVYQKFVEVGRVAFVAAGPSKGKLVVIVDVVDQNRALVDGPCSGAARQMINFKALQLTKFVVKIGPGARTGTVTKAWNAADISTKWAESSWAKRQQAIATRASLTDFDRYKLMKAKQARRGMRNQLYGKASKMLKSK
ncbi:large ribosomal subunit protein eL14-like [Watersipora subatra]|uniref:large ribosomal subunit protein eL14-like n=1 Tax=Watersipora subatra TaxID=2589382 RepID=UPI00355C3C2B